MSLSYKYNRQEHQSNKQQRWQIFNTAVTFSKVLSIVVVDLAQAPISFNQVILSAAQVDLTVLD